MTSAWAKWEGLIQRVDAALAELLANKVEEDKR
jgi:hypothetical protein